MEKEMKIKLGSCLPEACPSLVHPPIKIMLTKLEALANNLCVYAYHVCGAPASNMTKVTKTISIYDSTVLHDMTCFRTSSNKLHQ